MSSESRQPSGHKVMKRLHQLCVDTAKKAINELKLMQRYFSTPYYLLKLNQLTGRSGIISIVAAQKKKDDSNLFWSLTLGDCVLSSFFSLERGFESGQNNRSLISIKKPSSNLKLLPQIDSLTQASKFFSPINNKTVKKDSDGTVYYDVPTSTDLTPKNVNIKVPNILCYNYLQNEFMDMMD